MSGPRGNKEKGAKQGGRCRAALTMAARRRRSWICTGGKGEWGWGLVTANKGGRRACPARISGMPAQPHSAAAAAPCCTEQAAGLGSSAGCCNKRCHSHTDQALPFSATPSAASSADRAAMSAARVCRKAGSSASFFSSGARTCGA